MKEKGNVQLFVVLGLLVIAATLPIAVNLAKKTQELRRGATAAPDTVPPRKPTVSRKIECPSNDPAECKIVFEWRWKGDKTCDGCEGPVGWCKVDSSSSMGGKKVGTGDECDPRANAPFWWQVIDETNNKERVFYHYSGLVPRKSSSLDTYPPGGTKIEVSCQGRTGHTLRIDVATRDANGNMAKKNGKLTQVAHIKAVCPSGSWDTVPPNKPTVSATYDPETDKITFNWEWQGDNTCEGCEGPVQWCKADQTSSLGGRSPSTGKECDPQVNGPFWWEVSDLGTEGTNSDLLTYYHSGTDKTEGLTDDQGNPYPPGGTKIAVSCAQRRGHEIKIEVAARDANGNMDAMDLTDSNSQQPKMEARAVASKTCPARNTPPPVSHHECREHACVLVEGEGGDLCNSDADCAECATRRNGDANCDGNTNMIDYSIWLNHTCTPAENQTCLDLRPDFNDDKIVNIQDRDIWQAHYEEELDVYGD
jgi:hypothetical protein